MARDKSAVAVGVTAKHDYLRDDVDHCGYGHGYEHGHRRLAMSDDNATTRRCQSCGEWYDARAPSCYVCQDEDREYNHALKKANDAARLNGALSTQMQYANVEASAERTLRSARAQGVEAFGNARPRVPGYNNLVNNIKNSLESHPHVLDYYGDPTTK